MVTLIVAANSDRVYGRCDASCYNAKGPGCTCICGGLNHGVGRQRAIDQTRDLAADQLRELERRGGIVPDEFRQRALL